MEYWSIGVPKFHYSNTPSLQYYFISPGNFLELKTNTLLSECISLQV